MNTLLALCCLVSVAAASYAGGYTYHGKYPGKCSYDGLYYRDEKSFVFCSNGYSYIQECAPGSRNSGYEKFSYGSSYSSRDFCDVNLVDSGYGVTAYHAPAPAYAPAPAPAYAPTHAPAYEAPTYEAPTYEAPTYEEPSYEEPRYEEPSYSQVYHGKYPGKCEYDGLYYKDESSFVYCSNGNSYVQPCSPGTKNSAYSQYSSGGKYNSRDFCDINLVDGGYASAYGYGYEYQAPSYEAPKYEAPKYEAPKYEAPKYEAPKYEAPKYEAPKYEAPKYEAPKYEEPSYEPSYGHVYHGKYPGKCQYDGLYFKDSKSFVFCVNGQSYVQACAPGSRNSGYGKFSYGQSYSERDFCDVNLVDEGYGVAKAVYH